MNLCQMRATYRAQTEGQRKFITLKALIPRGGRPQFYSDLDCVELMEVMEEKNTYLPRVRLAWMMKKGAYAIVTKG